MHRKAVSSCCARQVSGMEPFSRPFSLTECRSGPPGTCLSCRFGRLYLALDGRGPSMARLLPLTSGDSPSRSLLIEKHPCLSSVHSG